MFYLKLFGAPSLESEAGPLSAAALQRRRLALLALLAVSRDRTMARDKLATFLFPESDSEKAHHALTDAVHSLRKALGKDAIVNVADALRLNEELVTSDVAEFERRLAASAPDEAIELYAGPFMDGFFVPDARELDEWMEAERARLQRSFGRALEEVALARQQQDDAKGALVVWQRLSALDPYNSRVALSLMRALADAGDRAGAIQQARLHTTLLREELGIEPDPEMSALVEQIRTQPAKRTGEAPAFAPVEAVPPIEAVSPIEAVPPGETTPPAPLPTAGTLAASPRRRVVPMLLVLVVVISVGVVIALTRDQPSRAGGADNAPRRHTIPDDVYTDFTRAKYHYQRVTEADLDTAIALLESVVARQPNFAEGHAQLALAYIYLYSTSRPDPRLERDAFVAAERALSLNPNIVEAYVVRGKILWTPFGGYAHAEAVNEYKHALALDPRHGEALFQIAQVYNHTGQLDASITLARKAMSFAPTDPRPRTALSQALIYGGNPAEALRVMSGMPSNYNFELMGYQIAWAQLLLGQTSEARATIRNRLRVSNDVAGNLVSLEAMIDAKLQDTASALARIRQAAQRERGSIRFHHTAYNIGASYALLGQADSALKWLRLTADEGFPCYPLYAYDPHLALLRNTPAFRKLLAELRGRQARYRKEFELD